MGKLVDLTGQKFGKLTVLRREGCKGPYPAWRCKCDCGNETVVRGTSLKRGNTKSCGCLQHERKRLKPENKAIYKDDYYEVYNDKGDYFTIDKKDYSSIRPYRWHRDSLGYWATLVDEKRIRLHNFLLPNINGIVDHANRDKSNNRRFNLRVATHSQNTANGTRQGNNTSGTIGVSWDKFNKKMVRLFIKRGKTFFSWSLLFLGGSDCYKIKSRKRTFGRVCSTAPPF